MGGTPPPTRHTPPAGPAQGSNSPHGSGNRQTVSPHLDFFLSSCPMGTSASYLQRKVSPSVMNSGAEYIGMKFLGRRQKFEPFLSFPLTSYFTLLQEHEFLKPVLLPLLARPIKEYKSDSESVSKNYLNKTQGGFP